MKISIVIILIAISTPALAGELIPVHNSPHNLCKPYGCKYYEWKFKSEPSLRYIATGYEDGIDYSIERITDSGKLELLLRVNPIVRDKKNKYWWGYPWVTRDIPIKIRKGQVNLYASFEHQIIRDGNISIPEWQKTMPALLLSGEHGEWNIEQKSYDYKLYSISELMRKARSDNKSVQ